MGLVDMKKHWMAVLLAATAAIGPSLAAAQDIMMDRGPRGGREGRPGPSGPGGPRPGGQLERSEGRPIFHDRESFPENRPAYRPDHAEAPRPPAPQAEERRPDEQRRWSNRGEMRPEGPRPDSSSPGRDDWGRDDRRPDQWRGQPWRDQQWRNQQAQDQRWRDDERRRREERDRWRRNYGDWRDHDDQAYGFAERRAWANQWNRGWRRDRRYDWMEWRSLNRGAYHLPRYYAPYGGYGYERFSSGVILEPMLFGRTYWLSDPYAYRLPPAYGPYRWVRYYNDAVLVDTRSGLVVDIVYDIFW